MRSVLVCMADLRFSGYPWGENSVIRLDAIIPQGSFISQLKWYENGYRLEIKHGK